MNPESLALLRGIKTSLLHLMATGPLEALGDICSAYQHVRLAMGESPHAPKSGTSLPAPPMHAVALEMAERSAFGKFESYPDPPSVDAACAYLEHVSQSRKQTVADEPWEAAP